MRFGKSEKNLAIDFGTSTTLIYEQGKGIVSREQTVVAVDRYTGKIVKYGEEAHKMLGRTPADIIAIHPVSGGVVSDYEMAALYLKEMVSGVSSVTFMKPCVLVVVPSCITGVEERATIDACIEAGARRVYLMERAVAIAVGHGYDISKPNGHMIIDIGGGCTEVSVVSAGGVVRSECIKFGGKAFDEAIVKYIRHTHKVDIGLNTAEELKRSIGSLITRPGIEDEVVKGRSITDGSPTSLTISSNELIKAFYEPMNRILELVHSVLETLPPELSGDLQENGIIMAGGGSLLYGMDKLLEKSTSIRCTVVDDAVSCAAFGAGKMLEHLDDMQDNMKNFYRRRQLKNTVY